MIFGYETGTVMPGLTAPARRVGFLLTDASAASLHANGGTLFDAAVRWAAGVPEQVRNISLLFGTNQVTIQWTPTPGALSYTVQRATAAGGPWTNVATGITGNIFTNTGIPTGTLYFRVLAENSGGFGAYSAVVQGVPAYPYPVVVFKGPAFLRGRPSSQPQADFWNQGHYDAVVKQIDANGNLSDPGVFTASWAVVDNASALSSVTSTQTTLDVVAAPPTADVKPVGIEYTVTLINGQTRTYPLTMRVTKQKAIKIILHFPNDTPETQVSAWSPTGVKYDLYNRANLKYIDERIKLAQDLYKELQLMFKQVATDLYIVVDGTIDLQYGGFSGETFALFAGQQYSPALWAMFGNGEMFDPNYINIFLVPKLTVQGGVAHDGGVTVLPKMIYCVEPQTWEEGLDPGQLFDIWAGLIGHEIGHSMGLDDISLNKIYPILNNLKPHKDNQAAMDFLLMAPTRKNTWMTDSEAFTAWKNRTKLPIERGDP